MVRIDKSILDKATRRTIYKILVAALLLQRSDDGSDALEALPEPGSLEGHLVWHVLARVRCQQASQMDLLHQDFCL
jgi:hypothetical protein